MLKHVSNCKLVGVFRVATIDPAPKVQGENEAWRIETKEKKKEECMLLYCVVRQIRGGIEYAMHSVPKRQSQVSALDSLPCIVQRPQ